MPDAVSAIARFIESDLERLRAISHNIANATTPGYRAQRVEPTFDALLGAPTTARVGTSIADGALQRTGRALDLALTGNAFFAVQTPSGVRLTRDGRLHLDADGQLRTTAGHSVLGDSGPLVLTSAAVRVGADGRLFEGDREVGRLMLVGVSDASRLRAEGAGLYAYTGPEAAVTASVHQGAVEGANTDMGAEMVRLLELTRHIESVQRATSVYDQTVGTGINRIGDSN